MKRFLVTLAAVFLLVATFAFAQGGAPIDSAVVATQTTGPTILDKIASLMAAITPILTLLVGTGIVFKYVPWLAKVPNILIPFLNVLIAFLSIFQGGVPVANAGVFGDLVHALSTPAKLAGSFLLSAMASSIYETFIRPTLEKYGIYKAGLTKEEIAAKAKVVGTS